MENKKPKEIKKYRITRDQYLQLKRDAKAKHEIKMLIMGVFDKIKNWK